MSYHITTQNAHAKAAKAKRRTQFVKNCETFWCDYGQRALDYAVIVLVPTLFFFPTYVAAIGSGS